MNSVCLYRDEAHNTAFPDRLHKVRSTVNSSSTTTVKISDMHTNAPSAPEVVGVSQSQGGITIMATLSSNTKPSDVVACWRAFKEKLFEVTAAKSPPLEAPSTRTAVASDPEPSDTRTSAKRKEMATPDDHNQSNQDGTSCNAATVKKAKTANVRSMAADTPPGGALAGEAATQSNSAESLPDAPATPLMANGKDSSLTAPQNANSADKPDKNHKKNTPSEEWGPEFRSYPEQGFLPSKVLRCQKVHWNKNSNCVVRTLYIPTVSVANVQEVNAAIKKAVSSFRGGPLPSLRVMFYGKQNDEEGSPSSAAVVVDLTCLDTLRSLDIQERGGADTGYAKILLPTGIRQLEVVGSQFVCNNLNASAVAAQFPSLTHLIMGRGLWLPAALLQALVMLPSITCIRCDNVIGAMPDTAGRKCPQSGLQTFIMEGSFAPSTLHWLARVCPHLLRLSVTLPDGPIPTAELHTTPSLPHVTKLRVGIKRMDKANAKSLVIWLNMVAPSWADLELIARGATQGRKCEVSFPSLFGKGKKKKNGQCRLRLTGMKTLSGHQLKTLFGQKPGAVSFDNWSGTQVDDIIAAVADQKTPLPVKELCIPQQLTEMDVKTLARHFPVLRLVTCDAGERRFPDDIEVEREGAGGTVIVHRVAGLA